MERSIIVTNAGAMTRSDRATTARQHPGLYWLSTMYIVLTSVVAGVAAILRAAALFAELLRLGYPPHFIVLLGSWEVLGAMGASLIPSHCWRLEVVMKRTLATAGALALARSRRARLEAGR